MSNLEELSVQQKGSIAIIIPYFGKWPEWIDLYLYSCERNSEIDWYFFTDCAVKESKNNIFIQYISFADYCQQISERLKIKFNPLSAYKLCDLKVFYGYIYSEILKTYEFWGFGDVDVVWGDIKSFYSNKLLSKYDVFSTHNDRLSGHFCLLRNNDVYVNLCFKIKQWENKLCSNSNYALDESDFSKLIFPESKFIGKFYRQIMMKTLKWRLAWEIYYSIFPFIHIVLRFKKRKFYFKEQHSTPILASDGKMYKYESDTWYYIDDRIYNERVKRNYMYLHFMVFKKNSFRDDYFWKDDFYKIDKQYDYSKGVIISITGIQKFK